MIPRERLQQFSFFLFYAGLILLVVSIPLSKFGMSVSQIMIALGWVLGGNFSNKLKEFSSSKTALAIIAIFVIHILGLFYTSDFEYAFKDLRIKLPLLILPLLLLTSPKLSEKQFEKVLFAVIGGVTVSTLISLLIYLGFIKRQVIDIRDISIFISHIRLALLCCVSVFISVWLIYKHRHSHNFKLYLGVLLPLVLWLISFLFLIQSITGLLIITTVVFLSFLYFLFLSVNFKLKIFMFFAIAAVVVMSWIKVQSIFDVFKIKEDLTSVNTQLQTQSGNSYVHFTDRVEYENGYPVWAYVCEEELSREWNRRSEFDYMGKDIRNQDLRFTLIRFLTSKGLKKDSVGIWSLSDEEIKSIEGGTANVEYLKLGGIGSRIHQIIWEVQNAQSGRDFTGHSFAQRFEYWRAALLIIKANPVFGVGTGDVIQAFDEQYKSMNTPLTEKWRLRSHNQYLSFGVAFGITGLLLFLFILGYLLVVSIKARDFLYLSFAITAIISMLSEDTLETQAGITFFTLFTCLFLFVNPKNHKVGGNLGS